MPPDRVLLPESASRAGLIVSADVTTLDRLASLVRSVDGVPGVEGIKIGFSLSLAFGLRHAVDEIRNVSDLPIIYDHQKAGTDIPEMGRPFAKVCREGGVSAIIVFPHSGPLVLAAFVDGARSVGLDVMVGVAMSHQSYLVSEGGYIIDSAQESILGNAALAGVDKFVLPATKPDLIARAARSLRESGVAASLFFPGIGRQGGDARAALRAAAPLRGVAIVGTAIHAAQDPRAAAAAIVEEMNR